MNTQGSLEGKKILVTRARRQAGAFSREIATRGAIPVEVPVIDFQHPQDSSAIYNVLADLSLYDWIVFTSANGVRFFFAALGAHDQSFPDKAKVAVVGKKTLQALEEHQVDVDVVPDRFIAEELFEKLKQQVKPGEKVLMPRGNLARKMLADQLKSMGADVCDLVIYQTEVCEDNRQVLIDVLSGRQIDAVTFTSSSTAHSFRTLLRDVDWRTLMADVTVACIGPIAAETAKDEGMAVDVIAKEYTIRGLLTALEEDFGEGSE